MNVLKKKIIEYYYSAMRIKEAAPLEVKKNFRMATEESMAELRNLLKKKYFDKQPEGYLDGEEGKLDMHDHIFLRLDHFRKSYIPFINHNHQLRGAKVLEIGGGTGCSTLALAEQGAEVLSIDLDPEAQEISKFRLEICNLSAEHIVLNATEIDKRFQKGEFDIIIYFAALEHMTLQERLESLRKSWGALKEGGMLCIFEAPNRLWFYDSHTSFLPFYYWLQEDIALEYGRYSNRKLFSDSVSKKMDSTTFSRWGRGVSYHELEIAIGRHSSLKSAAGLFDFQMKGQALKKFLYRFNLDHKYKKIIRKIAPDHIGSPFLEPYLDLALIKKTDG